MKSMQFLANEREHEQGVWPRLMRTGAVGLVLAALLLMAGCMAGEFTTGRPPDTGALETSLRIGESTEQDIRTALGEPYGFGRYLSPTDPRPRGMWAYYYEAGTLKSTQQTYLFVLVRDGRYDGYLWWTATLASQR